MDGEVVSVEIYLQRLHFLVVATPARLPFFRPTIQDIDYIDCFLKLPLKLVKLNIDFKFRFRIFL